MNVTIEKDDTGPNVDAARFDGQACSVRAVHMVSVLIGFERMRAGHRYAIE